MSKPKLVKEIGSLITLGIAGEDVEDRLRICHAADEKHHGACYEKAIKAFNTSLGWKETAPRCFDLRESDFIAT